MYTYKESRMAVRGCLPTAQVLYTSVGISLQIEHLHLAEAVLSGSGIG